MSELRAADPAAPTPAGTPHRKPLLSRVPAAFVRSVLKGHSSLGLAFAAAIYIVCLSGTLAVFAREFQRWENPLAPRVETAAPAAVQAALAGVAARAGPGLEHAYIYPAMRDLPWLLVVTDKGDGTYRDFVADARGQVIGEAPSPWSEFVTTLHVQLHLPRTWGAFLVGLTGVALLSSLISGLLAHPRIFRDAFHLRLGGSRRLQEADLHNRMGVWAMPFHLIVSTTGALLGLTTLIVGVLGLALFQGDVGKVYALFVPPQPKENAAPAPVLDLVPMYAKLAELVPGGRVTFIGLEHPTEQGGGALFNVEADGHLANLDSYAFDRTGLYHEARANENNIGESILQAISPLHFGWFGGAPVKLAYGLLGLAMTYLAASGVTIWLARRRDKGRPAPHWERLWAAYVWGQPVALAAAALAGMTLPGASQTLLLAVWGGLTLAFLAAALARLPADRLGRVARYATAALLAACVAFQLFLRGGLTGDAMGWAVNLAVLATAVLLIVRVGPRREAAAA